MGKYQGLLRLFSLVVLCFSFPENSCFMPSGNKAGNFCDIINGVFALAVMVFCLTNRKKRKTKGASAYENADKIYLPFGTCA